MYNKAVLLQTLQQVRLKVIDTLKLMLSEYKVNIERQEKKALVDSYSNKLDQTTLDQFNEEVDKYTYDALERELAYTLVKSNPSNFSLESKKHYIPKDNDAPHGINAILEKYTNK